MPHCGSFLADAAPAAEPEGEGEGKDAIAAVGRQFRAGRYASLPGVVRRAPPARWAAASRRFHMNETLQKGNPCTEWVKVPPVGPLSPAVPFCTRVSARMKPPLGRDSSVNICMQCGPQAVHHLDPYRLPAGKIAALVDFEQMWADDISLIEWPDRLGEQLVTATTPARLELTLGGEGASATATLHCRGEYLIHVHG